MKATIPKNVFLTNDFSFNYNSLNKANLQILTQNIYDSHEKLNDLIKNMEEKIKKTMEKQENEFFFAYRSHMSRVQMDLKQLKKQIEEDEKMNKGNEKIINLEKEMIFFKSETENLSKRLTEKTKELKRIKENNLLIQSEKLFLENKLITVLSKKKPQKKNNSLDLNNTKHVKKKENSRLNNVHPVSEIRNLHNILQPKDVMYFVAKYNIKNEDEFILDFEEILRSKEKESQKKIELLTAKLEQLKKTNIFLNYEINKGLQNNTELKSHLENCFVSVKNQIKKRKNQGLITKNPNENTSNPQNEITFDDFKITDKMKFLAFVLSNDYLIQLISDKIFSKNENSQQDHSSSKHNESHFEENKSVNVIQEEIENLANEDRRKEQLINKKLQQFYLKESFHLNGLDEKETCTPETGPFSQAKHSSEKIREILKGRRNYLKSKTLTDRMDNNSFESQSLKRNKIILINRKKENSFAL